jgi:uncharacterized protein (DUF302 family)
MTVETRTPPRHPEVLIFGTPKPGTLRWQAAQAIGIELPLMTVVWEGKGQRSLPFHHEKGGLVHGHSLISSASMLDESIGRIAASSAAASGGDGDNS